MNSRAFLRRVLPPGLRQALLRARLRLGGLHVNFGSGARIDSHAEFEDRASLHTGAAVFGSRVGRWTYFGEHSLVIYSEVGRFCSIAPHVVIGGGTHPTHRVATSPLFYSAERNSWGSFPGALPLDEELPKTHIGNDVWIGHSAVVLPGVRVGDGAVIGAGAVVTRDVEPYAVVAGVPARKLRSRFDPDDVDWLLGLKWWDWPDARLKELRPRFSSVSALREAVGPSRKPVEAGAAP